MAAYQAVQEYLASLARLQHAPPLPRNLSWQRPGACKYHGEDQFLPMYGAYKRSRSVELPPTPVCTTLYFLLKLQSRGNALHGL